jgi:hypothetical protein
MRLLVLKIGPNVRYTGGASVSDFSFGMAGATFTSGPTHSRLLVMVVVERQRICLRCGARCGQAETPRPGSLGARWLSCPLCASAGSPPRLPEPSKERRRPKWHEHGLVFASAVGTQRNANNVLRSFRLIVTKAGLNGAEWTPREMRHSFVSLLSDSGVPIENIARLVGHAGGSRCVLAVRMRQALRPGR